MDNSNHESDVDTACTALLEVANSNHEAGVDTACTALLEVANSNHEAGVDTACTALLEVPKEDVLCHIKNSSDNAVPELVRQLSVENSEVNNENLAPDGGWGWIVCLGSFTINFILDGTMFSFGLLMLELLSDLGQDKSTTSWIGSAQMGIHMCMGPVVSILLRRYSIRQVVVAGSMVASSGFVGSVFAPNIHVMIWTYGVVSGVGIGMIFLPAIIVVGHYFSNKRAIATGIATSGSGVGTFAYAYMTNVLLESYSWRGTVLLLAGLLLHCVICGMLFRPLRAHQLKVKTISAACTTETNILCQENQQENIFDPSTPLVHKDHDTNNTSSMNTKHNISLSFLDKDKGSDLKESVPDHLYKSVDNNMHKLSGADENSAKMFPIRSRSDQRLNDFDGIHARPYSSINHHVNSQDKDHSSVEKMDICNDYQQGTNLRTDSNFSAGMKDILCEVQDKSKQNASCSTTREKTTSNKVIFSNQQKNNVCGDVCQAAIKWLPMTLLTNKVFMLLLITFTMWTAQTITLTYLPDLAVSRNISRPDAAFLISVVGITNVLGRLVAGFITDCFHVPSICLYVVALSLAAVVNLALSFCDSYLLLQLLCAVFGLCMAVAVSLRTIVLVEQLGVQALTESFGIVALFQGVAFTFGPPIAGKLSDDFNSFKPPFIMSATMYAISAASASGVACLNYLNKQNSHRTKKGEILLDAQ